jgi:hypothetical protein
LGYRTFRCGGPGTLELTAEKIAQIFEEEDLASYRAAFGQTATSMPDSARKPPSP